ncbi:MAG: protein translocase subunit SecD [Acidobacteriota bacterium]|jgi:preprotein translocase subunit SecD
MFKIPMWKWATAILPVLAAALLLTVPREPGESFPALNVNLGLDLQGGVHLVMQVRTDDAVKTEVNAAEGRVRQELRDGSVTFERIERPAVDTLAVLGVPETAQAAARDILRQQLVDWTIGASGEGTLTARMGKAQETSIREQAVTDVLGGIRERVDRWGVAEPNIQRQGYRGSDRILVQLPGVDDPARVKQLITDPAFLEWKMVAYPPGAPQGNYTGAFSEQQLLEQFGGSIPDGVGIYQQNVEEAEGAERVLYWPLQKISVVTGNDLEDAQRSGDQFGQPAVSFRLRPAAAQRFTRLTGANRGKQLAILLDEKLISAPTISTEIPPTGGIITGNFTIQEAEDLAFKLRSGALRAGVDILEERTVGPSLGADSIRKGFRAGLLGLGLVVGFMLIWYRLSGMNAIVVLALNLVLILGIMAAFRATLTLPGIAGYILTVGMAVDANVLIFERIREELRLGKTVRSAVDGGFGKAFTTILDSNLTTLISAVALYSYGTGPIKGFAVTLSVGILANVFTAVFVSRLLFDLYLGSRPRVERLSI